MLRTMDLQQTTVHRRRMAAAADYRSYTNQESTHISSNRPILPETRQIPKPTRTLPRPDQHGILPRKTSRAWRIGQDGVDGVD